MSELEILQRQKHRLYRKKWSVIQVAALMLAAVIALISFFAYHRINRTQLIEYTERGAVDYRVQYADNAFFSDEWIENDRTYISSLVEAMAADFTYNLDTSSSEMKYNYSYAITAKLLVANKNDGTPYYVCEEQLGSQKSGVVKNQESLKITESVDIDYVKYDTIARAFVGTYGLENAASCTLIVTLDVTTLCTNNGFENVNEVKYSTSLNIPLAVHSISIHRTSAAPEGVIRMLEYADAVNRSFILILTIVFAVLTVSFVISLIIFLFVTRNEDVTYEAKIRRILRSYGSFIQKMCGEFDCDGYQIIKIKSFVEMLGVRDTIQSPVLMSVDEYNTCTKFLIPTSTKLLYVYEVKLEGYGESEDDE